MRTSILKTDLPVVDAIVRVGVQTPHRSPPGSLPQLLLLETAYDLAARSYEVLRVPSKWFKSTTRHFARPVAITPQDRVELVSLTLRLAGTRPSSPFGTQQPARRLKQAGNVGLTGLPVPQGSLLCAFLCLSSHDHSEPSSPLQPQGEQGVSSSTGLGGSHFPSQGVHSLVAGDRHPPDHAAPYPHTGGPPQWHLSTGRSWGIPFRRTPDPRETSALGPFTTARRGAKPGISSSLTE